MEIAAKGLSISQSTQRSTSKPGRPNERARNMGEENRGCKRNYRSAGNESFSGRGTWNTVLSARSKDVALTFHRTSRVIHPSFFPMPTYEYYCEKCQSNFDVFQSMKDDPFETCPQAQCLKAEWGQGKVKRQLGTGAGLIFKGSGFYITDYRSESYKDAAKKESGSSSSSSGKSEAKESKKGETKKTDSPSASSSTKGSTESKG